MSAIDNEDWTCGGWARQEHAQLDTGAALSFRERLLWLQEADRLVAELEKQRPWIDKEGVIHAARGTEESD